MPPITVCKENGRKVVIEMPEDETVLALAERIAAQTNLPVHDLRLVFKGRALDTSKKLADIPSIWDTTQPPVMVTLQWAGLIHASDSTGLQRRSSLKETVKRLESRPAFTHQSSLVKMRLDKLDESSSGGEMSPPTHLKKSPLAAAAASASSSASPLSPLSPKSPSAVTKSGHSGFVPPGSSSGGLWLAPRNGFYDNSDGSSSDDDDDGTIL